MSFQHSYILLLSFSHHFQRRWLDQLSSWYSALMTEKRQYYFWKKSVARPFSKRGTTFALHWTWNFFCIVCRFCAISAREFLPLNHFQFIWIRYDCKLLLLQSNKEQQKSYLSFWEKSLMYDLHHFWIVSCFSNKIK